MQLSELKIGCSGTISENASDSDIRRRLADVGFTEGCGVVCVGESFSGDPRAYLVKGSVFALRNSDAENIFLC